MTRTPISTTILQDAIETRVRESECNAIFRMVAQLERDWRMAGCGSKALAAKYILGLLDKNEHRKAGQ